MAVIFLSIILAVILGVYLAICLELVSAEDAAIRIRLGKPLRKKVYSGELVFLLKPFETLYKFPKQQQKIVCERQKILTEKRKFKIKGYNKQVEYSEAEIDIQITMYFYWPTKNIEKLILSYQNAPDPKKTDEVKAFFGDYIQAKARTALGKISWRECKKGRVVISDEEEKELSQYMEEELLEEEFSNPIRDANLVGANITMKVVDLPKELDDAISKPQIATFEKEALIIEAEGKKQARIKEGQGNKKYRQLIFEEGAKNLEMEILFSLREMSKNPGSTIFYGLPSNVANIIKEKTGIEVDPSDERVARIVSFVKNALEKEGIIK